MFTGYIEPAGTFFTVRDGMRRTEKEIDFSGLGRGSGMTAVRCEGIDVLGSTFSNLTVGSDFQQLRQYPVLEQYLHRHFGRQHRLGWDQQFAVSGNLLTDNAVPRGMKHADFMQFRFSASKDITISDNVMISGKPVSHGIYFGGGIMGDYRYDNIVISNNLVLASQRLAVSVEHGDGVTIVNNKVLTNSTAGRAPAAIFSWSSPRPT